MSRPPARSIASFLLWICMASVIALAIASCSAESRSPSQRVNDKLVASASDLGEEIERAIGRHVEAIHSRATCEKHTTNPGTQCAAFNVAVARAAAHLCGLQTQRATLYKIIENHGESRGVVVHLGESCDLE